MPISPIDILALLLTYLVFGTVGYQISKRLRKPISHGTWRIFILTTIAANYFMVNAMLISVYGFNVYLSTVLGAIGLGVIIGLAVRKVSEKPWQKEEHEGGA